MLKQQLITGSKYEVKCPYTMVPKGVCIHNTANDAPAQNEINYMKSNDMEVSFHIAIDDIEAIQAIPFNRNTWHAGDGGSGEGNRNYIAVEICYSKSGGDRFINAEKRAAKEVAAILKQYGWGIAQIKKHQDFSNKYCPHRTLDMGWQRFLNMIQNELNSVNPPTDELYRVRKTWEDASSQIGAFTVLQNAKDCADKNPGYSVFNSSGVKVYPVENPPQQGEYIVKEYSEKGKFTCTVDSINFRNKPYVGADNPIQGQYYRNEFVYYDYVVVTNKYTWISWVSSSSGIRRYMPVEDKLTGEKWGYFA